MLHVFTIFSVYDSARCLRKRGFVIILKLLKMSKNNIKTKGGSNSDFDNGRRARTSMPTAALPGVYSCDSF